MGNRSCNRSIDRAASGATSIQILSERLLRPSFLRARTEFLRLDIRRVISHCRQRRSRSLGRRHSAVRLYCPLRPQVQDSMGPAQWAAGLSRFNQDANGEAPPRTARPHSRSLEKGRRRRAYFRVSRVASECRADRHLPDTSYQKPKSALKPIQAKGERNKRTNNEPSAQITQALPSKHLQTSQYGNHPPRK